MYPLASTTSPSTLSRPVPLLWPPSEEFVLLSPLHRRSLFTPPDGERCNSFLITHSHHQTLWITFGQGCCCFSFLCSPIDSQAESNLTPGPGIMNRFEKRWASRSVWSSTSVRIKKQINHYNNLYHKKWFPGIYENGRNWHARHITTRCELFSAGPSSSAEYISRHISDAFNVSPLLPIDPPFSQVRFDSEALFLATRTS